METLMASSSSSSSSPAAILFRQRNLPVRSSNSFFSTASCSPPTTTAFIRTPLFRGRKLNHSFKPSSSSSSSSYSSAKLEIKCGVTEINERQFSEVVLTSDRPVLVEFIAPWCGPCRLIAPAIEAIAQEYEEKLLVVKIDHDSNPKLIQEYKVYGLPALILFKDGKEVPGSRREGAITKAKLKDYVDALLKSVSVA